MTPHVTCLETLRMYINMKIENKQEENGESKEPIITFFIKQESSKIEIPQTPELKSVVCLSDPISHNLSLITLFFAKLLAWIVTGTSSNNGPTSYPLKIVTIIRNELKNKCSTKITACQIIGKGSTSDMNTYITK